MTFEDAWDVARDNSWQQALWGVTFGGSVVAGVVIGFASRPPLYRVRWGLVAAASLALLVVCITVSVRSIEIKWQHRFDAATTESELVTVAERDGANWALAPFIGSFYGAIAATLCCGIALLTTWMRRRASLNANQSTIHL